jgi:hypothetical protein
MLTPEEELAEKLKRQRLQEQSDLELAKEAFGNTKKPLNNCFSVIRLNVLFFVFHLLFMSIFIDIYFFLFATILYNGYFYKIFTVQRVLE